MLIAISKTQWMWLRDSLVFPEPLFSAPFCGPFLSWQAYCQPVHRWLGGRQIFKSVTSICHCVLEDPSVDLESDHNTLLQWNSTFRKLSKIYIIYVLRLCFYRVRSLAPSNIQLLDWRKASTIMPVVGSAAFDLQRSSQKPL